MKTCLALGNTGQGFSDNAVNGAKSTLPSSFDKRTDKTLTVNSIKTMTQETASENPLRARR